MDNRSIVAQRQSQVMEELERQSSLLTKIDNVLDNITERFIAVLRNEPSNQAKGETVASNPVPLAAELRSNNDILESIVIRLNSVFDRCEL